VIQTPARSVAIPTVTADSLPFEARDGDAPGPRQAREVRPRSPGDGPAAGSRVQTLDILRAVAIVAVLIEHAPVAWNGSFGWSGVDLFFVLSGFLVSGLLFTEHQQYGAIDIWRFLARRALKIYPPFYAMIACTVVVRVVRHHPLSLPSLACEVLFVQNYGPRIWVHTWSLAVEEHFYLLLSVALVLLVRRRPRGDSFHPIPVIFGFLAVSTLVARTLAVLVFDVPWERVMTATHFRIDSLMFGVVVSYVFHYRPDRLNPILESWIARCAIAAATLVCLLPVLLTPKSPFLLTIGLTLVYLGYAGVLVLALPTPSTRQRAPVRGLKPVMSALASVGRNSYSIYIWHIPALEWIVVPLFRRSVALWHVGFWPTTPLFIAFSISVGVAMAAVIEQPVLAVRERIVPRRAAAISPAVIL
jgi:peptidoglycan/LPS O-acetylase OafA/YrhL